MRIRPSFLRVSALAIGLIDLLGASGCDRRHLWPYENQSTTGAGGTATSTTGTGAVLVCDGVCKPTSSTPFEPGPTMFAFGTPGELPSCPTWAPSVGFEGTSDLSVAAPTCPTCACKPASCSLPEKMHASAAKCANAPGSPGTLFDAPPAWEGTCTAENAIAAGPSCGGAPCQSVTIEAPQIQPCEPVSQGDVVLPPPAWSGAARECLIGPLDGEGCSLGQACAPLPPAGFQLCLFFKGDDPSSLCPSTYPDRHVVYSGVQDSRTCAPCQCGPASGVSCLALVSVFADGACGSVLGTFPVSSAMDDGCHDLPPGCALGSKSALFMVDTPGTCAPAGGALQGSIAAAGAVTLCCEPNNPPPK